MLRASTLLFGGIPMVLGGYFAQNCSVVPKGNRAALVAVILRSTALRQKLMFLRLRINMRLLQDLEHRDFSDYSQTEDIL